MNRLEDEAPAPIEFSRPVSTLEIVEKEAVFVIEADEAECAALARRFDLRALSRLQAELRIAAGEGRVLRLDGHLSADIVQACVVSLGDVPALIEEAFSLSFSPDAPPPPEPGDVLLFDDTEDPPEPLVEETLDLGEIVAEYLSLALPDYPRLPEASIADLTSEPIEKQGSSSLFSKLSALKGGK